MLTRVTLAPPAPGREGRHRTRTTVRSANRFSLMKVADAVAVAGHEGHVCRYREARTLLRWLGDDLRGLRVLDVAAGDGYWSRRPIAGRTGTAVPSCSSGPAAREVLDRKSVVEGKSGD